MPRTAKVLSTDRESVQLRELRSSDAGEYHALVQRSLEHLTRLGDYQRTGDTEVQGNAAGFADIAEVPVRFGVLDHDRLVGRVDLVPVEPPRYGLGYWLGAEPTGRGIATSAAVALLRYAQHSLAATDVFAGVTHGNDRSTALLRRLGFQVAAHLDTYTRFHLALTATAHGDPDSQHDAVLPARADH